MNPLTCSESTKPLTLGVVMDFFNPELLEGARAYSDASGIHLDVRWSVRGDWLPNDLNWDGILHGVVDHPKTVRKIKKYKLPEIALTSDDFDFSILPDYEACGKLAVDELFKYGVKYLCAVVMGPRVIDRYFMEGALVQAKSLNLPSTVFESQAKVYQQMIFDLVEHIQTLPRPLGIICPHAAAVHSLTNKLIQVGLRVPEDVSIVVIDKDPQQTAALAPVSLTAIKLNEWHRGFVAAEALHHLLHGKKPTQKTILIPPNGVHRRASTGHEESSDPAMAKALRYLRANHDKIIGVPDIVKASGASRRALEIRFRKLLNTTIHDELLRLRIEHAKHHLKEKKLSITDIAQTCGFSSVYYFSGAFKREVGISPKKYSDEVD